MQSNRRLHATANDARLSAHHNPLTLRTSNFTLTRPRLRMLRKLVTHGELSSGAFDQVPAILNACVHLTSFALGRIRAPSREYIKMLWDVVQDCDKLRYFHIEFMDAGDIFGVDGQRVVLPDKRTNALKCIVSFALEDGGDYASRILTTAGWQPIDKASWLCHT